MRSKLSIFIFDGTFRTTPFINRLVAQLAHKHTVYILGFNTQLESKVPHVVYVNLGSNQNKLSLLFTSLFWAIKQGAIGGILFVLKKILSSDRIGLQKRNLQLVIDYYNPDVIHLQWPSALHRFETVLNHQKVPVILSQRGYHNNVRPFVTPENFSYLEKWYPKLAGFHSVSKAMSSKGDRIYNNEKKIDQVIYTGLDINSFNFVLTISERSTLKIVSVGRTHWIKGYDYVIKACAILKEQGVSFTYTVIGGGDTEELVYLVHKYQLHKEVFFTGKIPQKEVFQQIQEADVLVMSSIEEGIANVAVEAMALGTVVVSTDCGGMRELITHEKEGLVVPSRNPDAIASALITVKNMPTAMITVLLENARQKVEKQCNAIDATEQFTNLYQKVIDSHQEYT